MDAGVQQAGGRGDEDFVAVLLEQVEGLLVAKRAVVDASEPGPHRPLDGLGGLGVAGEPHALGAGGVADRLGLLLGVHQHVGATRREAFVARHQELDRVGARDRPCRGRTAASPEMLRS